MWCECKILITQTILALNFTWGSNFYFNIKTNVSVFSDKLFSFIFIGYHFDDKSREAAMYF